MAVLLASRQVKAKRVHVSDLANESFVLFPREEAPGVFDTILGMCNDAGFSSRIENEPNMMQTVLSLVEAEEGVSIVPACVRNLRSDGVRFHRLQPDNVRVELVAAKSTRERSLRSHDTVYLTFACAGTLAKHLVLEGREHRKQAGHGAACGCGQIERLSERHETDTEMSQLLQCRHQIRKGSAPTIQAPYQHHIDFMAARSLQQLLPELPLGCAGTNLFHLHSC